jgi:CHAD domain-containing protein
MLLNDTQESHSFRSYGVEVIRDRLGKMLAQTDRVRDGSDIDAVHDMRVASRRLRAAITVFGPAFPSGDFKRFDRDVKAVTDELSIARDLDVMIETLEKLESTLPPNEQAGIELFAQKKRAERSNMQRAVVKSLDQMEKRNLTEQFDKIVTHYFPPELSVETESDSQDETITETPDATVNAE